MGVVTPRYRFLWSFAAAAAAAVGKQRTALSGEQMSGTKAVLSRPPPCCQWSPEAVGGEGSSGTDNWISGPG